MHFERYCVYRSVVKITNGKQRDHKSRQVSKQQSKVPKMEVLHAKYLLEIHN